jgi:hypothetical protein
MNVPRLVLRLAVVLVVLPLAASDTYDQEVSVALVKHIIVLRNFYKDQHLSFDSDGNLLSKATPGFGPTDGRVFVQKVELKPDKLIVAGIRPIDVFDWATEKWTMSDAVKPVAIEIRLPSGEQPNTAVPRLLNAVFIKRTELEKLRCSAEEQDEFVKFEQKQQQRTPSKDQPKLPDVASLNELR